MKVTDELFKKEMSRKEFLATLGLGVASLMGFSTVINMLFERDTSKRGNKSSSYGYGGSSYGGKTETSPSAPKNLGV